MYRKLRERAVSIRPAIRPIQTATGPRSATTPRYQASGNAPSQYEAMFVSAAHSEEDIALTVRAAEAAFPARRAGFSRRLGCALDLALS